MRVIALLTVAATLAGAIVSSAPAQVTEHIPVAAAGGSLTQSFPPTVSLFIGSPATYSRASLNGTSGRWVGPHSLTQDDSLTVPSGSHLVLRNQTAGPILAAIEDIAWTSDATSAAQVTTLQEFRELFSSEVLAPGQQLAVSHVAFLFSDLKGSTQLYEGIGDAAAYSRVSRHFDFIRQAVSRGGGSIIKTMGDGVMSAFHQLDDALGTAIRLQAEVTTWCRDQSIDPPLALKVGIHHGPAIAMTANDHLDYFGRTVNLAARVADQSHGGDVVVLREVLNQASRELYEGRDGLTIETFTTKLRGLAQDQRLVRLTVNTADDRASTATASHLGTGGQ